MMDLTDTQNTAADSGAADTASTDAGDVNALLGGAAPASDAAASSADAADAAGGDAGSAGGADNAEFLNQFSSETAEGEKASLQDWVKASGVSDINALAKIARDNQAALRDSGNIKVPGEGASEAEIAAYRKAIGVPDDPSGYAVPEFKDQAGKPIQLDTDLIAALSANAHKHGMAKGPFEALLNDHIQSEIESADAQRLDLDRQAAEHLKKWGDTKDDNLASVDAATKALGLSKTELEHLRMMPGGPGRALDLLSKVGAGLTEDTLISGRNNTSFGLTGEQAQKELDTMMADSGVAAKITVPGTPENARYKRLQDIIGADADRKGREGG